MDELSITLPDGGTVRKTADGRASVYDLLKLSGAKSPREVFNRLAAEYPEVVTTCDNLKFPGSGQRETPITTAAGWRRILTVLPGLIGKTYRAAANELVDQYLTDPEALAARTIDRMEPEALARTEQRARAKRTNKTVNAEIQSRGGGKYTFAVVANANNVAVTGRVASELKVERQVRETRDGMTTLELSLISAAEELETEAMRRSDVQGEGQIFETVREVTADIAALRRKYTGPRRYPHNGLLTVDV